MEKPTKENTLYLPIKQVYFDQIIAGTKTEEYREITPNTYKKYLDCDEDGEPYYESDYYTPDDVVWYDNAWLMACKDGKFPFFFREDIKFLNLAVGYNKVRDTAIVEVVNITPLIGKCLTLKKVDTIVNKNGENQKETEEIQSRRKNGDGEASLSRRRKSK